MIARNETENVSTNAFSRNLDVTVSNITNHLDGYFHEKLSI